ncbi:MAG: hypothetical protein SF162_06300 [bacterium]|nr:hypothetical protein [bacterium]
MTGIRAARRALRTVLILGIGLFAGALSVIGVGSGRESDSGAFFRAILACTPACMMDITPGATTLDQADALLDDHPWVGQYRMQRGMETDSGLIGWQWSGAQPAFIDATRGGVLHIRAGVVRLIQVHVNVPVAALCLHTPSSGFDAVRFHGQQMVFSGGYPPAVSIQSPILPRVDPVRVAWLRASVRSPALIQVGERPKGQAQTDSLPIFCG